MQVSIREGLRIAGKVKIDTYRAGMVDRVTPYLDELRLYKNAPRTAPIVERIRELRKIVQEVKDHYFIRTAAEMHNLVMDSPNYGLDMIIQRLVGINTYSLNILFIEIGTGSTTPTVNDTALTTPTARLVVSFQEDYATTDAIVQAFVTDASLPNGTYNEVGSFVDGTSTIGTGQLFNHALITPAYTKVSGQDTTIEVDFTLVNS
jgi:hypothetical protein